MGRTVFASSSHGKTLLSSFQGHGRKPARARRQIHELPPARRLDAAAGLPRCTGIVFLHVPHREAAGLSCAVRTQAAEESPGCFTRGDCVSSRKPCQAGKHGAIELRSPACL